MRLTTFIKAYRFALYNIESKVNDWNNIYLGGVYLPDDDDDDDKLTFIFSSGSKMQPGDMAISIAISIKSFLYDYNISSISEMTDDAVDCDVLAKEYISQKKEINDVGRIIVLLETILSNVKLIEHDNWESSKLDDFNFNFETGLLDVVIDGIQMSTDGHLVMFGN